MWNTFQFHLIIHYIQCGISIENGILFVFQKDKDSEREFRWLHCALTQQRLQQPIVMCGLGRLYSKQTLIEHLLDKANRPEVMEHIRTLKDVRELRLTPNPAHRDEEESGSNERHVPFICKLIGLEMSGKFRFVGLWTCGCVMSERALKEIAGAGTGNSSAGGNCPLCQQPFSVEDVVIINPGEEEVELMQMKMEMRQCKRKAQKKQKSDKKLMKSIVVGGEEQKTIESEMKKDFVKPNPKELKETVVSSTVKANKASSSSDCSSSSSTSTIKKEKIESKLEDSTKTSKVATATTKLVANPKRLGATKDCLEDPDIKRLKTDYSVAKDPNASDVYKSLFTTHQSDKEQNRAHWVTYNPFYN